MKELISQFENLADALEKKEPKEKIEELYNKAQEIQLKLRDLNLSLEEQKRFEEKNNAEIQKVMLRVISAKAKYDASGLPRPNIPDFSAR